MSELNLRKDPAYVAALIVFARTAKNHGEFTDEVVKFDQQLETQPVYTYEELEKFWKTWHY